MVKSAYAGHVAAGDLVVPDPPALPCPQVTAYLGDVIGAITLTGSAVAFGKLHGVLKSDPLNLPGACALTATADGNAIHPRSMNPVLRHMCAMSFKLCLT